jgi:hypothetical protein
MLLVLAFAFALLPESTNPSDNMEYDSNMPRFACRNLASSSLFAHGGHLNQSRTEFPNSSTPY